MSRTTAREMAMKLAFSRIWGSEDTYSSILQLMDIDAEPSEEDVAFADAILEGIKAHEEEIKALIEELAIGWKIGRMPNVDICILKIAIYEMLYRNDIPFKVSINEAVELAKTFGGENSGRYINGMLGTLAKRLETNS
jgi:N utilization substance protein B